MNSVSDNRRPLKTRSNKLINNIAVRLNNMNISPNGISLASIFFAAGCAFCLYFSSQYRFLPLLAALCIQFRLLCNLFDGLVAVEGGKGTASGELFNDIPDRISDSLIFIAAGYAVIQPELGWCAALLAVMTAYVRTLASSIGVPVDFRGPMAKQHRMAVMTVACLLTPLANFLPGQISPLLIGLVIVTIGSTLTFVNRMYAAYKFLEKKND